jgi:hypothetical protein
MNDMIAVCGCNCSQCPTYKKNLKTFEDRKRCSWGWEEYLNIRLSPEKLRLCDGCPIPDSQRNVYYLNCIVRKCALTNRIKNCAYCSSYPCEEVKNLHVTFAEDIRDKIAAKIGREIPDKDYFDFIEPYEGLKKLHVIHRTIDQNKIVEPKKFLLKSKIVEFPKGLSLSKKDNSILRSLYDLIGKISGPEHNVSFARREALKKKRPYMLTLLWTFGLYGRFMEKDDHFLTIDSKDFARQKNQRIYSKLKDLVHLFKNDGVCLELIPTAGEWLTSSGGLVITIGRTKNAAWVMTLSFDSNLFGRRGLLALQNYAKKLLASHDEKALDHFSKADMGVLYGKKS